jgi:hypothetical protein
MRSYWEYVGNLLKTCEEQIGNNKNPMPSPPPPSSTNGVGASCLTSLATRSFFAQNSNFGGVINYTSPSSHETSLVEKFLLKI